MEEIEKKYGCCHGTNIGVYLLVSLFGMSSWIAINGVFMEQPLLVASLPEGWTLPSYLAVAVQIGNISIFVTTVLHQKYSERRHQIIVIYTMILTSIVAMVCVAFLWEHTTEIDGQSRSVLLIFLVFVLSLTSCSSSVVFLPFMANFQNQYIYAFFIGEGMSGLIPSVMALAQGIGDQICNNMSIMSNTSSEFNTSRIILETKNEPNFSVTTHMVIIAVLMVISVIAFSLLNFSKFSKNAEDIEPASKDSNSKVDQTEESMETRLSSNGIVCTVNEKESIEKPVTSKQTCDTEKKDLGKIVRSMSKSSYGYYLLLTAWINALEHGVLLSLQTYSTLPYGQQTYHLAVVLSNMVDPVACFLSEFIQVKAGSVISILTFLGSLIAAYIVFLASLSPHQIPIENDVGSFLSVMSWIAVIFVLTFTKVRIVAIIRQEGKKALLWCGVTKQLGASVGAGLMYILIDVFFLFQSSQSCG